MIPGELRQSFLQHRWATLSRYWSGLVPVQDLAGWISKFTSRVNTHGLHLTVPPSVFHPVFYFTSLIFLRYLDRIVFDGKRVLEIGTGSGILALEAARKGARVVAVDINPIAVSCAQENVVRNGFSDRVRVIESDLFASVNPDERFDFILWNPPFYPGDPTNNAGEAWYAGRDYEAIRRFAAGAPPLLTEGGSVFFLVSSVMELEKIMPMFEPGFAAPLVVDIHRIVLETFAILRFDVAARLHDGPTSFQ